MKDFWREMDFGYLRSGLPTPLMAGRPGSIQTRSSTSKDVP